MTVQIPTLAEVRPEVAAFARLMELKLRKHDGDWGQGWKEWDPLKALARLREESTELLQAIVNHHNSQGQHDAFLLGCESADVANFAMMIADMSGVLAPLMADGGQAPSTWWNGEPCQARQVQVVVADDPAFPLYWAKLEKLIGKKVRAVEVTYGGRTFYLDDRDGSGWVKVTAGHGSPRHGHAELAVSVVVPLP